MPKTVILDKSQYYEAIFQLRDADEKLIDFIVARIEKGRKRAYASKITYYKNGADLYLSSTSFAIALGRSLQKNFGGTLKISKKLFTKSKKTGKVVYRVSVLFRPFSFAAGDVLKTGGRLIRLTGVGDRVGCIDLKTGKKAVIGDVGDFEKLKVYDAFVSKTYPQLEVLHPESFQSVPVENAKKTETKEVKVVISDNKVYLV